MNTPLSPSTSLRYPVAVRRLPALLALALAVGCGPTGLELPEADREPARLEETVEVNPCLHLGMDCLPIGGTANGTIYPSDPYLGMDSIAVPYSIESSLGNEVAVLRMSPEGEVLGTTFLSNQVVPAAGLPTGAFDGNRWLVAWSGRGRSGLDVYGQAITSQGQVMFSAPRLLASGKGDELDPALGMVKGMPQLAFSRESGQGLDLGVVALSTELTPMGGSSLSLPGEQSGPRYLRDTAGTSLSFETDGTDPAGDVARAPVSSSGAVGDPTGMVVGEGGQRGASAAVVGGGLMVAFEQVGTAGSDVFVQLATGVRVPVAAGAGDEESPAMATDGEIAMVAWLQAGSDGSKALMVTVLGADGTLLTSPLRVSVGQVDHPRVSYFNGRFLVANTLTSEGVPSLQFHFISP